MAHYAFLDENNIVTNVIVGKDEGETDWEAYYSNKTGQTCTKNNSSFKNLYKVYPKKKNK